LVLRRRSFPLLAEQVGRERGTNQDRDDQLEADEASSPGPAAPVGGCQATGWPTGAIAPVTAHMSQVLLPIGIAHPQRLQTAIADTSMGRLRTSMTILQQIDGPAIKWLPRLSSARPGQWPHAFSGAPLIIALTLKGCVTARSVGT
jgi:hypothetical protein